MSRVRILFLLLFLALSPHFLAAQEPSDDNPPHAFAVVELFTSEGCSSCPPADILLNKLYAAAQQKNIAIYPVSMHVDYWNQLGWRDPFSQKQFTERQNRYVGIFGANSVATPEFVVNGIRNVLGADGVKVQDLVNKALNEEPLEGLSLKVLSADDGGIKISYHYSGDVKGLMVNMGLLERSVEMDVTRGENAGRHLTHNNTARLWQTMPLKEGRGTVDLKYEHLKPWEDYMILTFIQDAQSMEIVAAAQLEKL